MLDVQGGATMENTSSENNAETRAEEHLCQEQEPEDDCLFYPVQLQTEDRRDSESAESEKELQQLLENINAETAQLNKFMSEENSLMNELCASLKRIMSRIRLSVEIPPESLPLKEKSRKAVLNETGHLVLVNEKGEEKSRSLSEYPPEVVMAVLWIVIPELAKIIATYKKRASARVNFFEKVKKELLRATKTLIGNEEKTAETTQKEPASTVSENDAAK